MGDRPVSDERISYEDRLHFASMMDSGRQMRRALGITWPCDHHKTPENTHTIAGKAQCKVCRRRRWMRGFRIACARVRLREHERKRNREKRQEELLARKEGRLRVEIPRDHPASGRFPMSMLVDMLAQRFDITPRVLLGNSRRAGHVDARSILVKILRERGLSYPRIGHFIGKRDHSSIINSVKKFDIYANRDPRVLAAYYDLRDRCDA